MALGIDGRPVPIMTLGARLSLAAACLVGSALITWAIYDPATLRHPVAVQSEHIEGAAPGAGSTLWLLAVGVSDYREAKLGLEFADDDARDIARVLRAAAHGGRYREVRSLVLTNENVTRASLLDGLANFLGEAGPDDVAVLFFAGHGVRDLSTGSYYFLPHPASADNLLTEGLRMTDFDEMLRIVRRHVRAVVVMLDTCHAGALGVSPDRLVSADEMAAQMSAGEGFFLLAASRPGEASKEERKLGHGAFTYSLLEALEGEADSDGDGALSVSEIFGYVAKRVPSLTGGQQHPYSKTEGTDLILVSTDRAATPGGGRGRAQPAAAIRVTGGDSAGDDHVGDDHAGDDHAEIDPEDANTIAVLEFDNLRSDRDYDWISKALRTAFDTELSKVKALKVFSPELMDHTRRVRGADSLYTARELGVARLLTGAFHVTGHTLRIDARIIDSRTGVNQASDSVEGELDDFFRLQKQLVLSMLRRLRVHVSSAEGESIQTETNTDVDAYRLLLESEGLLPAPAAKVDPEPRSEIDTLHGWLTLFPSAAHAQLPAQLPAQVPAQVPARVPAPDVTSERAGDAGQATAPNDGTAAANSGDKRDRDDDVDDDVEVEVAALLQGLRAALEAKDVDRVAAHYVQFSDRQRQAIQAYMDAADNLEIELTDIDVAREAGTSIVTFTRRDRFDDRKTGRKVRLEVRLSKRLAFVDGTPKIGSTP